MKESILMIMRKMKFIIGQNLLKHLNQWELQTILGKVMEILMIIFCLKSFWVKKVILQWLSFKMIGPIILQIMKSYFFHNFSFWFWISALTIIWLLIFELLKFHFKICGIQEKYIITELFGLIMKFITKKILLHIVNSNIYSKIQK